MKRKLADLLNRNLIAEMSVMQCAQAGCFMVAILVFAASIWKLAHVDLTAPRMLLGVACTTVSPLLLVAIALLLPSFAKREDEPN